MIKRILLFMAIAALFSSCGVINSSVMLKTPSGFRYDQFVDSMKLPEYQISPNDVISFQMYSNDGFRLVDLTNTTGGNNFMNPQNLNFGMEYRVDKEGYVKLPVLGRVFVKGLTVRKAETLLEQKFSDFYNKPFIIIKVMNKRVIIFPGMGGSAKVVNLTNENTNLLEALAIAGGISTNGKARKVKLIRGDLQNPKVYLIDLSTIDGIKKADMNLQANDIIYIEPRANISQEVLGQIAPIVGILTNVIFIYSLLNSTK